MTVTASDNYLLFFEAVQSIEDVFDYVEMHSRKFATEIEEFRDELEWAVDEMITISASDGWDYALKHGPFEEYFIGYDTFAAEHFAPLFRA